MLSVTFQNRNAAATIMDSPDRIRKTKRSLRAPRFTDFRIPRSGRRVTRPEIHLVVRRPNAHRPSISALERFYHSWGFYLALCSYHLRQRARQRAVLVVVIGCATTIGWGLGLLP